MNDPILDGLVAYWGMDGTSGSSETDLIGSSNLTDNGGVGAVSGGGVGPGFADCRDFERDSSQYLSCASNSDLEMGDVDFTIAGWVRLESTPAGNMTIAGRWSNAASSFGYIVYWNQSVGKISFSVSHDGTSLVTATSPGTINTSAWYFFVAEHSATDNYIRCTVRNSFYPSGQSGTTSHSLGVNVGTMGFAVGANISASGFFDGRIDEVGVWRRLLTPVEQERLYRYPSIGGFTRFDPDTQELLPGKVAYWNLDSIVSSTFLLDSALGGAGANTLTTVNTPTIVSGKLSNGLDLELSASQYAGIASNSELQMGDIDFTISAWVRLESKGAANQQVCGKYSVGGTQEYRLYYNGALDRWAFAVTSDGTGSTRVTVVADTFGGPSTATWYHIVCWHDAANNQLCISVNGQTDTASHSAGVYAGTTSFTIGASADTTNYLDGIIDDPAVWKRVLTSGERAHLYNSGTGYVAGSKLQTHYPSGGARPGGTATALVVRNEVTTGGVRAGSSAVPDAVYSIVATGGCRSGGTATAGMFVEHVGSGGARTGGTAKEVFGDLVEVEGGAVAGGQVVVALGFASQGGAIAGGTASVTGSFLSSGSCIISVIGSAEAIKHKTTSGSCIIPVTGSASARLTAYAKGAGGLKAGGSAVPSVVNLQLGTGGLRSGGTSTVRTIANVSGSEGVEVSGTSSTRLSFNFQGSGGVQVGGSASRSFVTSITASGGVSASGRSIVGRSSTTSGSCVLSVGGTASTRRKVRVSGSCIIPVIGTAAARLTANLTTSGGLRTGGSSSIGRISFRTPSGGISASGAATVRRIASEAFEGATEASGTASVRFVASNRGSGGVSASGSSVVHLMKAYAQHASGGVSASGTASVSFVNGMTARGGIRSGGSAVVTGSFLASGSCRIGVTGSASIWQHISEGILERLSESDELTELVGNRIVRYPDKELSLPFVLFSIQDQTHYECLGGGLGVADAEFVLQIHASSPEERYAISEAIRTCIEGETETKWGAVQIVDTNHEGERNLFDIEQDRFIGELDYRIRYRESRPFRMSAMTGATERIEESIVAYVADLVDVYPAALEREVTDPLVAFYETLDVGRFKGLRTVGVSRFSFQLTLRSNSESKLYILADRLRSRFHGLSGQVGGSAVLRCGLLGETEEDVIEVGEERFLMMVQTYEFDAADQISV